MPRDLTKKDSALLAILFAFSLFLTTLGANFGLPHLSHPDERWHMTEALRFGQHLNLGVPLPVKSTPTMLINFSAYSVFYVYGRLTGRFHSLEEFKELAALHPEKFYFIGRLTSGLLFSLTLFPLFFLSLSIFKKKEMAFSAVILYIFNPFVVKISHWCKDDGTGIFTLTLALYFIHKCYEETSTRNSIIAVISSSLAVVGKIYNQLVVIPLFLTFILKRERLYRIFLWFLIFYFGVLLFNPYTFIFPKQNISNIPFVVPVMRILSMYLPKVEAFISSFLPPGALGKVRGPVGLIKGIICVGGYYFLIILLLSMVKSALCVKKERWLLTPFLFVTFHILLLSIFPITAPRYFIPSIPYITILIVFLISRYKRPVLLSIILTLPFAVRSLKYVYQFTTATTTHNSAVNYILQNIPFEKRFLVEPDQFPTLPYDRESIEREFKEMKERIPEMRGTIYRIKMEKAKRGYKVWNIPRKVEFPPRGTPPEEIAKLLPSMKEIKEKYDYVLITGRIVGKFFWRSDGATRKIREFLKSLSENFHLERRFCSDYKKVLGKCIYLFNTHFSPYRKEAIFVKEKWDIAHY